MVFVNNLSKVQHIFIQCGKSAFGLIAPLSVYTVLELCRLELCRSPTHQHIHVPYSKMFGRPYTSKLQFAQKVSFRPETYFL